MIGIRCLGSVSVLTLLLLCGPQATAQGDPSVQEQVYGRLLARQLGSDPAEVERVRRRASDGSDLARGVRVDVPGLRAERLRFADAGAAAAFADRLTVPGPALVETRGDQVLVLRGPRVSEAAVAERARAAGWEVLPAPAAPSRVRSMPAAAAPFGEASATPGGAHGLGSGRGNAPTPNAYLGGDRHGIEELLRHHVVGDPLRALKGGGSQAAASAADPGGSPGAPGRVGEEGGEGDQERARVAEAVAAASPATMGEHQAGRVLPAFDALRPDERAAFAQLLDRYDDQPAVRDQLLKALAASSDVSEIAWLAEELDGGDPAWIAENTTLTGEQGIKQQFFNTCVPTTRQALRGEYDPVYAYRTRRDNSDVHAVQEDDPYALNDPAAREQRVLLEREGGRSDRQAVPRSEPSWIGMSVQEFADLANEVAMATGLVYEPVYTLDVAVNEPDVAIDLLAEHLARGRAVPIAVTNGDRAGGHAAMATSVRTEGGQRSFLIFDPWDGSSTWVPEEAVREHTLDVAGWDRIFVVYAPEPAR